MMIDNILHIGLGVSSRSGGDVQSGGVLVSHWDNSAELEQQQNAAQVAGQTARDPYYAYIMPDHYVLLSDGTNTWKVGHDTSQSSRSKNDFADKTVAEVLHTWLTKYYRHGLLDGSEPDYDAERGGWIVADSSARGAFKVSSVDPHRASAYAAALSSGKVITLSQVLKSANPTTKVFYVPVGYYYQGDISEAPSVSTNDASAASVRAGYGNTVTDTAATSAATDTEDYTSLYLLLPIIALFAAKSLSGNKNKRKRKRR